MGSVPTDKNTLLFVGDMHLGRNPVKLPSDYDNAEDFGPVVAWQRTVQSAIEHHVLAVILAGDVVESLNDRYAALHVLSHGIKELAEQNIPVYAVVGNHDVEALPRLEDLAAGFHIIGRGSTWESVVIERDGEEICQILGWSFSERRHEESPLLSLEPEIVRDDVPSIGLLHCDVDQSKSPYAPVRRTEFNSGAPALCDAWLLGHVHAPSHDSLSSERPVGYLGSLVGLDPGEPDQHGPWLTTIEDGKVSCRQLGLAPIRFETLELDVTNMAVEDKEGLEDALHLAFRRLSQSFVTELSMIPDVLGVRVKLIGNSANPQAVLLAAEAALKNRGFETDVGSTRCFVEKILFDVKPVIDLLELAQGHGPLAPLAGILTEESSQASVIHQELRNIIASIEKDNRWQIAIGTREDDLGFDDPDAFVRESALSLLAELQQQLPSKEQP